jgi:hypothetical protein
LECLRRNIGNVTRRDHRQRKVGSERIATDALVLDQRQNSIEILEERNRAKDQHIRPIESTEALFLGMHAHNHSGARGLVCSDAAQEDDISDAALADCSYNGFAHMALLAVIVGFLRIVRQ